MSRPKSEIIYLHKLKIGDLFSMRTITDEDNEFYMFLGREECNCAINSLHHEKYISLSDYGVYKKHYETKVYKFLNEK